MPRIEVGSTKLEALLILREARASVVVVTNGEQVLGTINERGLVEQLFLPPQGIRVPGDDV